jgi:hypothetical protein
VLIDFGDESSEEEEEFIPVDMDPASGLPVAAELPLHTAGKWSPEAGTYHTM